MNSSNTAFYQPDVLGSNYEQMTLNFADDYDGKVIATLVRKKAAQATKKAVLYIHGFSDYFFQTEMAEQFNQHGYDFYALDLRKYGRSKLPHQKFYYVLDLREYDAEIAFRQYIQKRKEKPLFANARSVKNALDRARMRQANRIFDSRGQVLTKKDLVNLEANDILQSTVFNN